MPSTHSHHSSILPVSCLLSLPCCGIGGYFPDGVAGKPWKNTDGDSVNRFYAAIDSWLPSWNMQQTGQSALCVDWVKVYQ